MTIERRPWLGFLNPGTDLREARAGLTIGKIYTVEDCVFCVDDYGARRTRPAADWGDPVVSQLARDELYMRLRNDAGLSHADATAFIKECPTYEGIRHALDDGYPTGRIMARLVVWEDTPQGHAFWSAHAKACPGGWV